MGYTPPYLEVRKVGGQVSIYPPSNTTDDVQFFSNRVDTNPSINMIGGGAIELYVPAGSYLRCVDATDGEFIRFRYSNPDTIIDGKVADKNIFLNPAGTGKVKFGTHTGSGDVACNGSIAIIDAAGNARKLMTTA